MTSRISSGAAGAAISRPQSRTQRISCWTAGCLFDGNNDVGWSRLSGNTLGVSWYGTSIDEADMALNTRFTWSTTCAQVPGAIDLVQENGHVAGLDHSSDPNAVTEPSYQTARCSLGADDQAGTAALY